MLYISRRVGRNTFGVVDTDDYVEEVVSWKDIEEAVLVRGLDIVGIKKTSINSLSYDVDVYQNPAFAKSVQGKASVLYGVNIKVSGTEIVDISVPADLRVPLVRIRLSDYGQSLSKRILNDNIVIKGDKKLILVLDDSIKVMNKSFENISHLSGRLKLDVTEVTNERILINAYASDNYRDIDMYMMDNIERLDFYLGVGILQNGRGPHAMGSTLHDVLHDPDKVCEQLGKKYGQQFRDLVDSEFEFKEHPALDMNIDLFWRRTEVVKLRSLYKSNMLDTGTAVQNSHAIFWGLRYLTTANAGVVRRFELYVKEFDISSEYRKLMVRLCMRFITFIGMYLIDRERG